MSAATENAAQWMAAEVRAQRELYQADAVIEAERRFGADCVRENDLGNRVFAPAVLAAFRRLTGDAVVWEGREKYWRLREKNDDAGRKQS